MQAQKPESHTRVQLPELGPMGRETEGGRLTDSCPTTELGRGERGHSNCPELQEPRLDLVTHTPRPERCARAEAAPGLLHLPESVLQHHDHNHNHHGSISQDRVGSLLNQTGFLPVNNDRGVIDSTPSAGQRSGLIDSSGGRGSVHQSPVSGEELFGPRRLGTGRGPLGSRSARIGRAPSGERVRGCALSSVTNGWLPLRKEGVQVDLPCLDRPLCQRQVELRLASTRSKYEESKDDGLKRTASGSAALSADPSNEPALLPTEEGDGKIEDNWSMSMAFRSCRLSSGRSTPNINEASSRGAGPASPHKDGPAWSVWRGREDGREGLPPGSGGVSHSGDSLRGNSTCYRGGPTLQRTASVPDVLGAERKTSCSSITITSRRVSRKGLSRSQETLYPRPPSPPIRAAQKEPWERVASSRPAPHIQKATVVKLSEYRQNSSVDRLHQGERGRGGAAPPQQRHSYTEGAWSQEEAPRGPSPRPSFSSYLHVELAPWSASSVLLLDKSLSISLGQIGAGRPGVYRSTLSLRLGGSPRHRAQGERPETKQDRGTTGETQGGSHKPVKREWIDEGHSRSSQSPEWGCGVPEVTSCDWVNRQNFDSNTQLYARGLSFGGAGTCRQNAAEAENPGLPHWNLTHRLPTRNVSPVDASQWGGLLQRERTGQTDRLGQTPLRVAACPSSLAKDARLSDLMAVTPRTLSLREALQLFRPDFISRSQERVRRLGQRARRRRALLDPGPEPGDDRAGRRGARCTTPLPFSDNLFRPRERCISGREMHTRSRRIYNKLPEVTRKKEEERRRRVTQTNRLRADLFKKKLLDQILQR